MQSPPPKGRSIHSGKEILPRLTAAGQAATLVSLLNDILKLPRQHWAKRPAAKEVHVQMVYLLPAMLPAIDHNTVAFFRYPLLTRNFCRHCNHVAKHLLICLRYIIHRWDNFVGDY